MTPVSHASAHEARGEQGKVEDISNRVQAQTIDVVDLEEKRMLARIEFRDGVAELTHDTAIAANENRSR